MSPQPTTDDVTSPRSGTSAPVLPRDRLGKVARTTRATLYLDEGAVDALLQARADLEAEQRRLDVTVAARLAQARAHAREQDQSIAQAEDGVHAEDEADLQPLRDEVAALEKAAKAAEITFVFRSVGRARWRAAIEACPPSEEDRETWKREGLDGEAPYSSEALLAWTLQHALVSPRLGAEEISDLVAGESWNDQEVALLWATALEAQTTARSKR